MFAILALTDAFSLSLSGNLLTAAPAKEMT